MTEAVSVTASDQGRPRRSRRWLAVLLVAAVVDLLLVGYVAAGYLAYDELSKVSPHCLGSPYAGQTTTDFVAGSDAPDLDLTPYHFADVVGGLVPFPRRGADDPRLVRPAESAERPVVLLVHGYTGCRRDTKVLLPAGITHCAGYGVLLIDMRNHGESDSDGGRWAGGAKEYRDVLGAWDWLVAQGYPPASIGLFGISLGAATVTIATGEEPRVAATWADSSYADFATASAEYAESKGYPGWVAGPAVPVGRALGDSELATRDPIEEVRRLAGRPFFIVHGLADTTILPHNAIDLARAAAAGGTPVEPWLVPQAEHVRAMLLQPERYEAALLGFFGSAIGTP